MGQTPRKALTLSGFCIIFFFLKKREAQALKLRLFNCLQVAYEYNPRFPEEETLEEVWDRIQNNIERNMN